MILSIWRYSHLVLAVSSFIFIALAALTGIVLAIEPVDRQVRGYDPIDLSEVTLSEAVITAQEHYLEVFSLQATPEGFLVISALDQEGNMVEQYIHPLTGEKVGEIIDQHPVYEFATSLHRSLFLKSLGRFFVGLASFLLLLISITGLILVAKRQQGIRRFFHSVLHENFYQYYHIYLGRLSLVPIVVITVTGTYLSLLRFEVIPEISSAAMEVAEANPSKKPWSSFPIFQQTMLDEVRQLDFPFSTDEADPFVLQLQAEELEINQYSGTITRQAPYPMATLLADWSILLHTGRGSIWWSVVLGLSCVSILFFIYSGFAMTFQRRASRIKNRLGKDDCEYVILVGSETGTTIPFAMQLHMALLERGLKSYITEPNRYTEFPRLKHLVFITSTYGIGEAPANADEFEKRYESYLPCEPFRFTVVGFGSLAYSDFCQYAYDTDDFLAQDSNAERVLPVHTVNNRSWESFRQWAMQWGMAIGQELILPAQNPAELKQKKAVDKFVVTNKTLAADSPDDTFIVQVATQKWRRVVSGDLLAVYPPDDPHERLYSMSVSNGKILLSVKRHEKGICSQYLDGLKVNDSVSGRLVANKHFHFPKRAHRVIMVATGTGIAPFFGMLDNNHRRIETHLYWGGRGGHSFELYRLYIEQNLKTGNLTAFHPAYSREGTQVYVQHLLAKEKELLVNTLHQHGVIMICGSIGMQREVIDLLEEICSQDLGRPLSYYQNRNQLLMDCY